MLDDLSNVRVINHGTVPIRTYIQGEGPNMTPEFLPEDLYGRAIQSFSIFCTDVICYHPEQQKICLVVRRVKPMNGWWFFGGKVFAAEMLNDAMNRLLKGETGLLFDPDHSRVICKNRYLWSERQQEPQNVGSDNVAVLHAMPITEEQAIWVGQHLNPKEYDPKYGVVQFGWDDIQGKQFHPAIRDAYKEIFL